MFQEHKKEIDGGGRKLVIETGKIARQADGAVMVTYGDTKVLCTASVLASACWASVTWIWATRRSLSARW